MLHDPLQQAWQQHASQTRVEIEADLLLKEVQQSQRQFRATIFWRDFREVGVALLMIPLWIYMGAVQSQPWTWYLTIPALIWVAGFILIDRIRQKQKQSRVGEPLFASLKESLSQVDHQIWLLRHVFWWYLLPFVFSLSAFFTHSFWLSLMQAPPAGWLDGLLIAGLMIFIFIVIFLIFLLIDQLNQYAIQMTLEPSRQELLALLKSLGENASNSETYDTAQPKRLTMSGKFWMLFVIALLCGFVPLVLALAGEAAKFPYEGKPKSDGPDGESLAILVADLRQQKKLVGLAAMIMVDGQVRAVAADGERMAGSGVRLELEDRWHLGSISKSITATMIARLVESGQMKWTDSVGECFPDAALHDDWKPVTLEQLLTHTAGAPANFSLLVRLKQPELGTACMRERQKAVVDVLTAKPVTPPGEKFAYSNVGYTIAGVMAEKTTGLSWEELTKREVFDPLKLDAVGFGPPKSPDKTLDQPRGHRSALGRKVGVNDQADNTPIMGPAGTVHMTLDNLLTYGLEHLRGHQGSGQLLIAETYQSLHTPHQNDYAYGWVVKQPSYEIPQTVYWHNGSNTMWYALIVFIPGKDMVVAVTSNDGDVKQAEAAAWKIVETSANQFHTEQDSTYRKSLSSRVFPRACYAL